MKKINLTAIFILITFLSIAQSPFDFNYQAVARDAQGQALKNQSISLRISILDGGNTGSKVYEEIHNVTSSNIGVINLLIGKGTDKTGAIKDLSWKTRKYWLKVEMDATGGSNFSLMSTTQLVSVPYALHAETATHIDDADADPNNEIQNLSFNTTTNQLTITNGNSITIPTGGTDADADPLNEIQTITKSGNTVTLSKNGGTFTDSVNDADADPANELQTLSKNGSTITLSKNGGTFTDEVNDADADAANELQNLSFNTSTNQLTISNGNSVTIPTGGTDADADPNNEIQTLSKNGNTVTLSKNGGSFTDEVNDADADAANELQNLSLSGNTLTISNGNQVDLTPITGPWQKNTYGIIYEANSAVAKITEPSSNGDSLLLYNFGVNTYSSDGGESNLLGSNLCFKNGPIVQATYGNKGLKFENPLDELEIYTILNKDSLYQFDPGNDFLLQSITKLFPGNLQLAYDDFKSVVLSGFGLNFRYKNNRDLDLDAEHGLLMYQYQNPSNRFMRLALMPDSLVMYNSNKNKTVLLGTDTHPESDGGVLKLYNGEGLRTFAEMSGYSEGGGDLRLYGKNQNLQFIAAADNCDAGGCTALFDTLGENHIQLWVTRDSNDVVFGDDDLVSSRGHIYSSWDMFSPVVQSVTDNVVWSEMNNYGFITEGSMMINTTRQMKYESYNIIEPSVSIFSGFEKEGTANFFGTNGNLNVSIFGDGLESYPDEPNSNYGAIYVYDSNGIARAGIEVNPYSDAGEIWADVKNFRVTHPNNPNKNIVYASLEGPEAAAYTRGTAQLDNGKVFVKFPEHYQLIANAETMTVILTPLYSKTFGLAVVKKTNDGIWVEELMDGKGNFSFDWEVKCVRKGHEDFKVIRDKQKRQLAKINRINRKETFSRKHSIIPDLSKSRHK